MLIATSFLQISTYASGNEIIVTNIKDFQSKHNYASETNSTWVYTDESADSIDITFSEQTETEPRWDVIYILDGNDTEIGQYDGTELSGQTIFVLGSTVKVRLESDVSEERWGFAVTNIKTHIATIPIDDFTNSKRNKTTLDFLFSLPREATNVEIEISKDGGNSWNKAQTSENLTADSTSATVVGLTE